MSSDKQTEGPGTVIRAYIDAARSGEWQTAYAFFAKDITFRIPGHSRFAGEHHGRQAAIDYIETARAVAHGGDVTVELVDMLESHDRVALIVHERFNFPDRELEIRRTNVYRVKNGKIVEIWIFEANQYEADALFA